MQSLWLPLALSSIAGLSTGLGGLTVFFARRENTRFLAVSLGFSAGVMIYVSLVELFVEANTMLGHVFSDKRANFYAVIAFFIGMLFIALIDKLIPCEANPHEVTCAYRPHKKGRGLKRTGVMTALVIAIHNFPEGIAAFVSATQSLKVALPIIFAIAIHNVPEGISVAAPIYYATGSRKRALMYSVMSGLTEPIGALIGYLILRPYMNDTVMGCLYAGIAGIMVFISLDELLPSAEAYGEHHMSMYGLVGGMIVMALSLWLFK